MYKNLENLNLDNLIKTRLHLGHKSNKLNSKLNTYIYGTRHNISIFDIEKIWKPFKYLFYSLVEFSYKKNTFFIVSTNNNLPTKEIISKFLKTYPFKVRKTKSLYITGYVDKKWIGGIFSNWKVILDFINFIKNSPKIKSRRYQKYLYYLKGIKNIKKSPLPDFLLALDPNKLALEEAKNLQIPILGLIDSNTNPDDFLYKFFGNDDSIESIEFFFEILKEAIKEGRLKEQELFLFIFLKKLKKKTINKI